MKIRYCNNCKKYTLKEKCACNKKTMESSHKFKQPKHLELTIKGMKDNARKKRN